MESESKSGWVTGIGVVFAVLSASYFLVALTQNLALPADLVPPRVWEDSSKFPPVARFMLEHLRGLVFVNLVIAGLSLIASVALVLRRNWGRLLFIAMMLVGVAWSAIVVWMQFSVASALQALPAMQAEPGFSTVMFMMRIVVLLGCSAFAAAFAAIAWRLAKPEVRREFGATRA